MTRTDIINYWIIRNKYTSYLEIGVQKGINFSGVLCDDKVGVDPDPNSQATIKMTSDEFFRTNKRKFDIIFIDGLHHAIQVYKDIINALEVLNEGGIIVCHDMLAETEGAHLVPRVQSVWNGDCWMAFVWLKATRSDLEMLVLDTDCGCGLIRKGSQELVEIHENLTYENFRNNRVKWLNLQHPSVLPLLDWK